MPHLFELLQNRKIVVSDEYMRLIDLLENQEISFDRPTAKDIIDEIQYNINYIVEKCNYELKTIDNWCWALEKNKLTSQAVEFIQDTRIALEAIEYNHYLLKGNPDKKKSILLSLSHHIEPILQSKKLDKNGYRQLESNAGFMLNNFNIRHNNKSGKKENEFIKNIEPKELESWYDKTYNTILMVIVAEKEIDTNKEIVEIKKEYTFKN